MKTVQRSGLSPLDVCTVVCIASCENFTAVYLKPLQVLRMFTRLHRAPFESEHSQISLGRDNMLTLSVCLGNQITDLFLPIQGNLITIFDNVSKKCYGLWNFGKVTNSMQ